ncbi:hypothetical protein BXA06_03965 [Campylobacter lari]|nr:hypothetical protein [Campylobacter lari]EDP6875173.1 hypothetical protein [Campylobacter lari]
MDNLKLENRKIIDVCDLFVTFKSDVENLFSIIKIDNTSPKIERLSIFSIPQEVRQIDPNLKYQPTYKLTFEGKDTSIFLGDDIIGFNLSKNKADETNIDFIFKILELIEEEIQSVARIGIKRIFNNESINNQLSLKINNIDKTKNFSQIKLKEDNCLTTITNAENHQVIIDDNRKTNGYLIEIITFYDNLEIIKHNTIKENINNLYVLQEKKYNEIIGE